MQSTVIPVTEGGGVPGTTRMHESEEHPMSTTGNRLRRVLVSGAVVAGAGLGAGLGAAGVASAATSTTTTPAASSTGTAAAGAPASGSATTPPAGAPDPATLTHGPGETLLTGTQLTQATAAATAAVPGATIIRAETNSSGGYPYEVHLKKADGTDATVELNSNFGVITTISGFGAGPAGGTSPGGTSPGGTAPSGTPPTGSAPTGSAPTSAAA
jgi:hypothetical protein